jgi:hypothetical protein
MGKRSGEGHQWAQVDSDQCEVRIRQRAIADRVMVDDINLAKVAAESGRLVVRRSRRVQHNRR